LNTETESRSAGLPDVCQTINCSFSEEKETHQLFSQTVQLEDGKIQKIRNGELQTSATKLIRKIYRPL
jgi:hypothetical protein